MKDVKPRTAIKQKSQYTKKANFKRKAILAVVFVAVFTLVAAASTYLYVDNLANEGEAGKIPEQYNTPKSLNRDVINIVVCGIDYSEDDGSEPVERDLATGKTDVILFMHFNLKDAKLAMMQIPRDTYIGDNYETGGTGKINGVFSFGKNPSKIANLAEVLKYGFGLSVDNFITIDMDAFKAVIDAIEGLDVYIPRDIDVGGGNVIPKGPMFLNGERAELMVRNRNYPNADIDRLSVQRYLYAGLYNKFKLFPMSDVVKVLPVYAKYVNTDMSVANLISLAAAFKQLSGEDIVIAKEPGEGLDYKGHSVFTAHKEPLLNILNEYFRSFLPALTADELGIPELAYTNDYLDGTVEFLSDVLNTGE